MTLLIDLTFVPKAQDIIGKAQCKMRMRCSSPLPRGLPPQTTSSKELQLLCWATLCTAISNQRGWEVPGWVTYWMYQDTDSLVQNSIHLALTPTLPVPASRCLQRTRAQASTCSGNWAAPAREGQWSQARGRGRWLELIQRRWERSGMRSGGRANHESRIQGSSCHHIWFTKCKSKD